MTHPVVPPGALLKKWEDQWFDEQEHADVLLIQAFQAGADRELGACCEEIIRIFDDEKIVSVHDFIQHLRAARRPKPQSLKEQALKALAEADVGLTEVEWSQRSDTIRRALEQLDD